MSVLVDPICCILQIAVCTYVLYVCTFVRMCIHTYIEPNGLLGFLWMQAITSNSKELQDAGKEAMQKFMAEHMDIELVHTALRPLLLMLADYRHLNTSLLQVNLL